MHEILFLVASGIEVSSSCKNRAITSAYTYTHFIARGLRIENSSALSRNFQIAFLIFLIYFPFHSKYRQISPRLRILVPWKNKKNIPLWKRPPRDVSEFLDFGVGNVNPLQLSFGRPSNKLARVKCHAPLAFGSMTRWILFHVAHIYTLTCAAKQSAVASEGV